MPSLRKRYPTRRVFVGMYWWEDRLLEGIARFAAERNWQIDCRMRWTRTVPDLDQWDGDGIIANVGVTQPLVNLVSLMRRTRVPIVGTQPIGDYPSTARVIGSHQAVGRVAAEHFLDLGFQNFAYVSFADNPIEALRCAAFRSVVIAAKKNFMELSFRDFVRRMHNLPVPLGMMAANDVNAVELMHACVKASRYVPDEFAILGVDDTEILCKFAPIPLSSVNCNFELQGYQAAALLDRLMAGKKPSASLVVIPPKGVTVRRSTDLLPVGELNVSRAITFLRAHFRERIHTADAAAHAGIPLRRLQKLFLRHSNTTLGGELTRLRVEHAKALLVTSKLKAEAVAHECGFANRLHFTRAFKRLTRLPPRAYRKAKAERA